MPTDTLKPAGTGTYGPSNWNPSGAATRWECILANDAAVIFAPAPGSVSYLSVLMDNLDSTAGGVTGDPTHLSDYVRFSNATLSHGLRLNATNSLVANLVSASGTKGPDAISRPGGGKWSVADVNAAEIVEYRDATGDVRVDYSWVDVTWTKAAGGCVEGIFNLILPWLGAALTARDLLRIRQRLAFKTRFTDAEWQEEIRCLLSHPFKRFCFLGGA